MATTGNKNSPSHSHAQEQETQPQRSSSPPSSSSSSHPKPETMPSLPTSPSSASPPPPRLATTSITARHNSSHSTCSSSSIDDIAPGSWKSPVHIDDADLTFDGKPLNLLHEENQSRWMLEHCDAGESMRGRRREVDYSRRKGDNHDAHSARTNKT